MAADFEWTLQANSKPVLRLNGTQLEIYPLHHDKALLQEAPVALAPSRYCLREWEEYIVRGAQDMTILDGEREDLGDGVFRFRFENRIGRATLHFTLATGRVEELPVEVLSTKYPTADEHLRFFGMLLRDLSRRAAGLPFAISAPTEVAVDESATTPTPLFVYHFLLQHDDELRAAIETILAAPHRRLGDESRWVPIAQAAAVDAEMLSQLVTHPEHLVKARQNATFACAAALKGHLPAHVWQFVPRDSYDTPENRFVRAFLGMLLQAGQEVREQNWWQNVPRERQTKIAELVGYIAEVLRAGMFDEVGDMIVFPASSQVLLRREGYRELLMLWRLFQVARQPFFADLQEAIALRDVATLYEFWCFFRLAEELAQVFASSPMGKILLTDRSGLVYDETRFDWAGQGSLVFNREFRSGTSSLASYSIGLRPDFTFIPCPTCAEGDLRVMIFDAKFRFESSTWQLPDDDSSSRVAKRADLYKMHTYRDALRARSAIVLFPGDRGEFYQVGKGKIEPQPTFPELLKLGGVGALSMKPEKE